MLWIIKPAHIHQSLNNQQIENKNSPGTKSPQTSIWLFSIRGKTKEMQFHCSFGLLMYFSDSGVFIVYCIASWWPKPQITHVWIGNWGP